MPILRTPSLLSARQGSLTAELTKTKQAAATFKSFLKMPFWLSKSGRLIVIQCYGVNPAAEWRVGDRRRLLTVDLSNLGRVTPAFLECTACNNANRDGRTLYIALGSCPPRPG